MPRQSTIRRLPRDLRDQIGALLDRGRTLDEIREHLATLGAEISRSALGRYKQQIDKVSERIRRSREVAEALVRNLGDEPESKTTRLNVELMHSVLTDMLTQIPGPDEEPKTGDDQVAITLDPMGAMLMAKALDHLAKAKKSDADLIGKLRDQARKEEEQRLAKSVDAVGEEAKNEQLTAVEILERVRAIYRGEA